MVNHTEKVATRTINTTLGFFKSQGCFDIATLLV